MPTGVPEIWRAGPGAGVVVFFAASLGTSAAARSVEVENERREEGRQRRHANMVGELRENGGRRWSEEVSWGDARYHSSSSFRPGAMWGRRDQKFWCCGSS